VKILSVASVDFWTGFDIHDNFIPQVLRKEYELVYTLDPRMSDVLFFCVLAKKITNSAGQFELATRGKTLGLVFSMRTIQFPLTLVLVPPEICVL